MSEPQQAAMLAAHFDPSDVEVPAQQASSTDARASGRTGPESSEVWADVPGHSGYQVSTHGRIRSLDRYVPGKGNGWSFRVGRLLRQDVDELGYHRIRLGKYGLNKLVTNHIMAAFHGRRPEGLVVRHLDGNPTNNRLENLRWGTQAENMQDAVRHGTLFPLTKSRCPRNHLLEPPNLVASQLRAGRRECKACANARIKIWSAEKEGRPHVSLKAEADERYARIMQGLPK